MENITALELKKRELLNEHHKCVLQLEQLNLDIHLKIDNYEELRTAQMQYASYQDAQDATMRRIVMLDRRIKNA